ncbi:hypothetical protein K438DRAFT_2114906 [Mycena galopus ATCC 62051]|nr:hypothetical protein K438DRAFT_2114906 [Mycena galopus ATCC 62051]
MAGKWKANDDNSRPFINTSGPPQKRPRHVPQTVTEALRMEARRQWEENQHKEAAAKANFLAQLKAAGYKTLHKFLVNLLATKDQHQSSQVSQTLINNGDELLELICARQPELVSQWISKVAGKILKEEGTKLAQLLRPPQGQGVSTTLESFSLEHILADAEYLAPTLCILLCSLVREEADKNSGKEKRRDIDLVLSTVICLLVQTRNKKSSEYQTTMSFYLLACSATCSQFEVLNHAGICLSYQSMLQKVKDLGQERLAAVRKIQCLGSNDHLNNGTTATLIILWGFAIGDLPLEILPPRKTHLPVLEFTANDLLPSLEDVQQLEALHRWHIEDILPPSILVILVHTTEQCTLPAMQIDESSLDGTINVSATIFQSSLKMTEDDIKRHSVVMCTGDQLNASLFDKVAVSRCDDIDLLDNLGQYRKEQLKIFHEKVAGTRMTVNEHWGTPNSKSLWSLWKINSLLGCKPITAGWKLQKLPPFRQVYKVMIDLTLPANILDGFRIFCPCDTVEEWVELVPDWQLVRDVAAKVHQQLCSACRVSKLRCQSATKCDPIFENISLFNRDTLTLLALRAAVKHGDVGGVLCVSTHWMVMFHGTGHMPKYADAIFCVLTELKSMHPKLREAYLMNWLANSSGKLLGFKEMDLLQEHKNFWLKVIYNAQGSNQSWAWLGMILVSIFALRDVIWHLQLDYKIPHNSKSHSNPSTAKDVRTIRDYLELYKLQSVYPEHVDNDLVLTARDLMEAGAAYANTVCMFKTFRPDNRKTTNLGTAHRSACPAKVDDDKFADPDNYGQNLDLDLDFVAMTTEAILAIEETEL